MAKRDPEKTARNKIIARLSDQLRVLLPDVLAETGISSIQSLHAIYGGKFAEYIDIKNEVIYSPEHFISLYLEGFKIKAASAGPSSSHAKNLEQTRNSPKLQEYLFIFLKRTYLRNLEALSKKRPRVDEAAIWIGQNNATMDFSSLRVSIHGLVNGRTTKVRLDILPPFIGRLAMSWKLV